MDEVKLPEGWEYSQLLKLGTIVTGKTPSTKDVDNFGGNVPFIKPGDLDKGGFITKTSDTLTESGLLTVPKLPVNAIVVTCIGNLGKVGITTKISATNQQINSFICNENLNFKFLYYQICTLKPWLENESSATTIAIVNKGKFSKAPISIPSLAEQKIIADKLDTLLAQVDSTKAQLEKIPQILKRFRQAVLVAAVSGNLTEEWRAQNPDQTCTKIVSLGDIIIDGPQNGIYKPSSLYGSGHKIVRIDSFYDGVLCDWNTFKRVQLESSDVKKWSLRNNDILINRVNSIEYLGKCGLVENLPEVTVFESNIMRITLNPEKAVAKFVTIFLSSIIGLSRLRENAKLAVNQASINQKDVKSCKIELPSISEQTEIVHRVEQLFSYADTIEKQVQNALERVNNLTHSILAKAFRGELTAQWRVENPDLISGENSAQALLVQIQQQRSSIKTIKRGKGNS
uniref:restriction endonuclease subunit S n=1 Tax=Serratia quinivorans TaxID=137545 RepID=UPI0035C6C0EF